MTSATTAPRVFGAQFGWASAGIFSLVFLAAFEALAVTTVMPLAAAEFHGEAWYALAFSAPLASGVVGLVVAGNWADRYGPLVPLFATVVLFAVGLVIVGTATSMTMLIVGRVVQGLGSATIVPMFVVIARLYPDHLRSRMFAGVAISWSLPALIGPGVAGLIGEAFGWRWAFLGVLILVGPIVAIVGVSLGRRTHELRAPAPAERPAWSASRILWSVLAAVAILGLNLTTELEPLLRWPLGLLALTAVIVAFRPLFPPGTLRAGRGLPTVVLLRILFGAAFFGAEVYVPYLLVREYGWSVATAGLALSGAGLAWAVSAWVQGRVGTRVPDVLAMRVAAAMMLVALVTVAIASATHGASFLIIPAWVFGAFGGGFAYPRISSWAIELSPPGQQGFTSSALAIGDSGGTALALAVAALVTTVVAGFAGIFAFAALIALLALLVSGRTRAA